METGSREDSSLRNLLVRTAAEPQSAPDIYETALARAEQRLKVRAAIYRRERAEAEILVPDLLCHPPERQQLILRNNPRYCTWGVLEQLLQRSWAQSFESPVQAERLAHLALLLADRLDASFYGTEPVQDLRARAWGYIGNARRLRADLTAATRSFAVALSHLRRGTREPTEHAVLLDLQASLRRAQRRFDDALCLLRRALALFISVGDHHRAGRTLLSMEIVLNYSGDPQKGIPLLYRAIELIDPSQEPRVLLCAWHNLIDGLVDAGRHLEARRLLPQARPIYKRFPEWSRNRQQWVAGKMALGLRQDAEGEALLTKVRTGFLAEDAPYEAALVSLELSALYTRQGRTAELKQLAAEMVPIFSSRQIHREAASALAFWKHAVDTESAGFELAAQIIGFLKRARYDNDFLFVRPGGQVPASE
jgi:tetratricopeptide (TPR) repeat protein